MVQILLFIILLTLITGVGGLAFGGVLATLFKRESPRATSLLLSFTAGLMLCIVSFDMVPEAMEATSTYYLPPVFLVAGFAITFLLNCWIDKSAHHDDGRGDHQCACGHHDLHTAGIVLAAAVALHNMPVGMSIAVPLLHDGSKARSAIAVAALSGLPTVAGALIGYFIGSHTPLALAIIMSIAGGAMLYVVFFELLPEAYRQWRSKWAILATVVGFALGVLLIFGHSHVHVH